MSQETDLSELREKVKLHLTNMPEKDFNVLVVGKPSSGKSTFINSMIMAVTGKWKEVAPYGGGADARVTMCLKRYVMFNDNILEVNEPHPMPNYKKNVVFWDCAGFNDATEDVYTTIVSLALDGRIPDGTNVYNCMDETPDQLKSKFRRVDPNRKFDRLVFTLSAGSNVPYNLVEAIKSGAKQGHDVPIMVVVTMIDTCDNPHDVEQRALGAQKAFNLEGNNVRFKTTSLYCKKLAGRPDQNDYQVMMPHAEIDKNLLNCWMNILDPVITATHPKEWCVLS